MGALGRAACQVKPQEEKAAALAVENESGLGLRLTVNLPSQVGQECGFSICD